MGPTTGGYQVAISGTNLTGATAVSFGGMAAPSFTVNSPTQITAVVPASTLFGWRAQGVSVRVTTPGGKSARCALLQARCAAAFFYASSSSLTASGRKFSHQFSGSIGHVTYAGTVTVGSWAASGSVQSSGNVAPEALLGTAKLSLTNVSVHLKVSGSVATEQDIKLPLPGLPPLVGVFLRLIPRLQGKVVMTDTITADTLPLTIGWVSGTAYHQSAASCSSATCLGDPTLSTHVSGSLIVGPWLRIGLSGLNVGAGPAVGLYGGASRVFDACAGIQAEANVQLLGIHNTYNVYGPFNLSGTFAKCPLASP